MNKVALITAASRGIGAACATELAAQDFKVVLMARSEDVHLLARKLGGVAMQGSTGDADDLRAVAALAMDTYGHIDAVVNNTGHPKKGPLLELADADWHAGLDLLLLNVIRMAQAISPVRRFESTAASRVRYDACEWK